jgi:hypothetical protein
VLSLVIWPSPAGVALGAAGVPGTITQGPVGHKQLNALIVARDIAWHTRDVSHISEGSPITTDGSKARTVSDCENYDVKDEDSLVSMNTTYLKKSLDGRIPRGIQASISFWVNVNP